MAVFRQSGCSRAKVVVFGQIWLYSGKKIFDRANVVVIGQSGRFRAEVVVFGQSGCIWAKRFHSGKVVVFRLNCCKLGKWLFGKVVVYGQKWLYLGKVFVFGQKLLYSCKVVVFGQNWL